MDAVKSLGKIASLCGSLLSSLATLAKVAILSRKADLSTSSDRELVILANGPSLRGTLDNDRQKLLSRELLAVNFFANTPEFFDLKPRHYVLADPHFFLGSSSDPNVERLWRNMAKVDWEMVLHIPSRFAGEVSSKISGRYISLCRFNMTPAEGVTPLKHSLYSKGLAMPRPRNVLIPSLMEAIRMGCKRIFIAGADHSWTQTLGVDDDNRVVSIQPHFYADGKQELKRVASEYQGYHLHDILNSMTVAFRSYFDIARYARTRGVEIINVTPGSFIDAFPRGRL